MGWALELVMTFESTTATTGKEGGGQQVTVSAIQRDNGLNNIFGYSRL